MFRDFRRTVLLRTTSSELETLSSVSLSGRSWVASFMSSSMVKVARPVLLIHKGSVHLFEHALLHELHEY